MEFKTINTTLPTEVVNSIIDKKIKLKSSDVFNLSTILNIVKIDIVSELFGLKLTHDSTELVKLYKDFDIKSNLINIYGKSGKLYASSRTIQSLDIPLSELPANLEYIFSVTNGKTTIEYGSNIIIPNTTTTFLLTLDGVTNTLQSDVTLEQAIVSLDNEIVLLKNNLQNFSFIYDNSQKKVVTLQSYLTNLSTKIDNLTKAIDDVKTQIENL